MAVNFVSLFLQRILLPLIIIACAFMRPTGISFAYLLLYFALPFVPIANAKNVKGSVGAYFLLWIVLSSLLLVLHTGLQIALFAAGWENLVPKCSFIEILLRHIGFINLITLEPMAIIEWIIPEILIFFTTLILYIILLKIVRNVPANTAENEDDVPIEEGRRDPVRKNKHVSIGIAIKFGILGPLISLATLFIIAVLRPSVPGGLYFLVFLGCMTYWACYRSFDRYFRIILQILMAFNVFHVIGIFAYQTPWSQQLLSNSTLAARLAGLEPLFISSCKNNDDIREISFNDSLYSDSYLNPISILLCYYILALTSKNLISQKLNLENNGEKQHKRKNDEDIALSNIPTDSEENPPSIMNEISMALHNCGEFLYLNSYILTSIIMMVWSIVYHSWLTFVLLIWANILWMIPNQRKTMLRCSPFIVIYAELLLIAQYIYGMDLTDEELPSSVEVTGINLQQIGFTKPVKYPCLPLMLKAFFTLMFWITMRQLFKEANENKQKTLRSSLATHSSDETSRQHKKHVAFLEKFAHILKFILVKLWIWIIILVIFLCGITGQRMTGFRICYMALFLSFVLAFQLSWRSWMRIMYGYWLVLIVYAMSILILIYTYQFDRFDTHWKEYLGVSLTLQRDIGLEKYKIKDLFLHLLNPTVIVIMTVFQIHYFHSRFLDSLKSAVNVEKNSAVATDDVREDLLNDTESDTKSDYMSVTDKQASLFKRFHSRIKALLYATRTVTGSVREFCWIFFEIHLMKIVFVVAFWCCISNVCLLHVCLAFLTIFAIVSSMKIQIVLSRVISILMSILFLAKMIYQVDYINHKNYDAICEENSTASLIYINNAEWFGLSKITESVGLVELLKCYIVYMIIVTLHAIVTFRQTHRRIAIGVENKIPHVIFEGVTRNDAEINLKGLFKFLMNYAYYKFGLEVSMIALVAVISYRQDILAIIYAIWLCILLSLSRSSCSKLWSSFQFFIVLILILQYILFVGLPPGLCMEWPWNNSEYISGLQSWAMVPGPHLYKQTSKLMFDFILLMCVFRQYRVFSLERKMSNMNLEHPAGTNKSIVNDIDNLDVTPLENPVPDFISNVRNWLDVLKIAVLNGFFWVTLAVVFLAGTNIISLFSIGYLIGSFVFLWQGTDFYLRPIRNILKWWFILISYNIVVIAMKTALQIGGCLFLNILESHACWFVHLFGVSCIADSVGDTLGGLTSHMNECPEILDESGLTWDAICFSFLLFQLRIFKSYYFHHIINDTKASTTLASRGAELIEELREKEIDLRNKREKEVIRKIKEKMQKIKAKQERMQRNSTAKTHLSESLTSGGTSLQKRKSPFTHAEAIRSGDYYMFDDLDEEIELDINADLERSDPEERMEPETARRRRSSKKFSIEASPEKAQKKKFGEEGDYEKKDDSPDGIADKDEGTGLAMQIFDSVLNSTISYFNSLSKNYRYVTKILGDEKKILKESKGFGLGARTGTGNIWTPFKYNKKPDTSTDETLHLPSTSQNQTEIQPETLLTIADIVNIHEAHRLTLTESDDITSKNKNRFLELLIAIWFAILSNTELVCYIVAIINQIAAASLLSLIIPLMIFLWGTLSIPRPTKTFWITLIAYTQTVVLIKCVFQFKMIWFNTVGDTLTLAKAIGIQHSNKNAGYDLLLLLMLFFHRFLLKSQGLWKSKYKADVVDDGAYILLSEAPQIDETDGLSPKDAKETVLISQEEKTLILTRQNPDDIVNEEDACVHVSNFIEEPGNYLPEVMKVTGGKYCSPIVIFLKDLLRKSRLPTDVYAYMFLCDFINFLVLLFGFAAFDSQREDGGITTYLEENRVPLSFLIMLILQFILIIVDRIFYLRKAIKYRLGYHLFLVLGIHIWMFFVIPLLQGKMFNTHVATVLFYFVKCIYFILSSYQLRCGYPARIFGNIFTKGYSIMNMMFFQIYMAIPLLYDLRMVLDWVCTDTTMTLFDWLKMEDIFSGIYCMKCMRQLETDMPVQRGIKKPVLTKAFMGGAIIFIFTFLIWGPFVLFAMSSTVGIANTPFDMSISLRIGPYEPVYGMSAQDSSIHKFDQQKLEQFKSAYLKNRPATTFLSDYDHEDIAAITFGTSSASIWGITPPDAGRLLDDLIQNETLTCRFRYTITRNASKVSIEKAGPTSGETTFELTADHPGRGALIEILQGRNSTTAIKLAGLLPKFLKIKSNGEVKTVQQLLNVEYRDVSIKLNLGNSTDRSWWDLNEFCEDPLYAHVLGLLPFANCESQIIIYTFSDKVFPSFLNLFTAGGIIGMYTTFIFVGWRFFRSFITGTRDKIMFEELPSVDRVLQLCLDIYLVREALEFTLEEDLFAKLIFLYRSPETMIKWTRPTNEDVNGEINFSDEAPSEVGTKKKSE